MKKKHFLLLMLLAILWGASFLWIRVAAPSFGPFVLMDLRVLVAAGVLGIYAWIRKKKIDLYANWKDFLILGAINAAIPFTLIAYSELVVSSSLASILNALTPLCTAVVAWMWVKDPLRWKKITGLLVGVAGVMVLVGLDLGQEVDSKVFYLAVVCSLVATISYAFGGVYISKYLKKVDTLSFSIGQQVSAGIWLLPFALTHLPTTMPTWQAWASLAMLAIVSTAIAYLIYFSLIQSIGSIRTLMVTFLNPIFGTIFGAILLHEPVSSNLFIGLILILFSIFLVSNLSEKKEEVPVSDLAKKTAS
ncbi:DMT family transporter [Risungbinella massiliensis]|uniref:DMT family transporter n=1 Tax=Risungbinella massiliensis TaxID=1329796 RepID=UPI0005CBA0D4|nr:DMT family transporter [Risungbinella massiliensis]